MTVTEERIGPVAVLTIDNPPVNALSTAVRGRLLAMAALLEADPEVRAVVLRGAGKLFVGGADISEFDRPPEPPTLPEVIAAIERSRKPWVAAIHGAALGGGLELALGCHARLAAPGASLGLPEVGLGLIPGAGGTQRLPRLVGLEAALPVIAERVMLDGPAAARCGLVERIVEGDLLAAAVTFAEDIAAAPPVPAVDRPLADPGAAFWDAAAARFGRAAKGLTAPMAALAAVRFGVEQGVVAGLAEERETFLRLRGSEEAAALRHLFFAERAAPRPAALRGIAPRAIGRVGIVGAGTMGAGIAAALRNAGLAVVLSERDETTLARGMDTLRGIFDGAVKRGLVAPTEAASRLAGVEASVGLESLAGCDLVIEAVFEDLAVKQAVFAELARLCRANAVLATNTSYIDPRKIFAGVPGVERCVGLHFFSPAQVMKLLEIVPLPETAPDVLATAFDLARRMGKVPVQSGICEGFIGNRILRRMRGEAEALVAGGVAYWAIDAAMRGFGFAMGPFETQDLSGLDISFLNREAARAKGAVVPETPGDLLVRAGRKGQKTGGGWYDYGPGDRRPQRSAEAEKIIAPLAGTPREMAAEEIVARLLAVMASEGEAILAEGVAAQPSDIDLVEVHGYGFPRAKGGPMFQMQRRSKT